MHVPVCYAQVCKVTGGRSLAIRISRRPHMHMHCAETPCVYTTMLSFKAFFCIYHLSVIHDTQSISFDGLLAPLPCDKYQRSPRSQTPRHTIVGWPVCTSRQQPFRGLHGIQAMHGTQVHLHVHRLRLFCEIIAPTTPRPTTRRY